MKPAALLVLCLGFPALPVLADELDDLGLPPLPGEEQGLPDLPESKPSATPQSGKAAASEPALDLPPLPGEEPAKESSPGLKVGDKEKKPAQQKAAPKAETEAPADLDLPVLPGDSDSKKVEEKKEDEDKPEVLLMTEEAEPAAAEPASSPVEKPKARASKAEAPAKRGVQAVPQARAQRVPSSAAPGISSPPLPGMEFWTASLLGPWLPRGGRAILVYLLLSLILPWAGQSRFAAAAALRLKQFAKKA